MYSLSNDWVKSIDITREAALDDKHKIIHLNLRGTPATLVLQLAVTGDRRAD